MTFISMPSKLATNMSQSLPEIPVHIDEGVFGRCVVGFWRPEGMRARTALVMAVVVNSLIFTFGANWLQIPRFWQLDGSLVLQPSPVTAIGGVILMIAVTTLVGTILAGAVRFEAGIFAASFALMSISYRCGDMRQVLGESNGQADIYWKLSAELIVLNLALMAMWGLLWYLGQRGLVRTAILPSDHLTTSDHHTILEHHFVPDRWGRIAALITQVLVTMLAMMLLCQTEAKNQALASVGLAAAVGTIAAYISFPVRPSIWYWTGPLIVGLVGYISAATGQVTGLTIGSPQGIFGALARPLPVDYASTGVAGAILGYWMVHKMRAIAEGNSPAKS